MKKLAKYWPVLLILGLSILTVWPLFLPGYFSHHDDLQVMRIFEMRRCLADFQIPCRWIPDMGFGNGFPLFNYYGVLPYYIGAILSYFLTFLDSAKALFFIPLILGGVSMYFLGKEMGGRWVGLTAGVLYLFAPYRSLDAYVRGAVAESFALAIIPLVFYFALKLSKEKNIFNFTATAISLGAFLITHNIMTMLFTPLLFLFLIYVKMVEKSKNFRALILSTGLGFGLSAFFLLPAFLEKSLVQTDNLISFDLNFRAHFVTIRQLFLDRNWGYGASVLGPLDSISFQIGWPHWWLAGVALVLSFWKKSKRVLTISLIGIFLFSAFMTHTRSAFIWEEIEILKYTQFPWRFLSLSIFSASLLGGIAVFFIKETWRKYAVALIILTVVFLNYAYFRPDKFYFDLTDSQKLSGELWQQQKRAGILDYLPKGAYEPMEEAPLNPQLVEGEASINNFINRSDSWEFNINVSKKAKVEVPVFDFPNWSVFVNGEKVVHAKDNLLRRINFYLEPGVYKVSGKLENTQIRVISNLLTLASVVCLIYLASYGKNKFKKL